MRPIKFRGKRVDNGEWVFGSLLQEKINGCATASIIIDRGFGREYKQIKLGTVGQFTGLLDKDGKEIYEGDILKGTTNKWRLEDKPEPHDFVGYVQWEPQCDVGLQWVLSSLDSSGFSPLNVYVHCVAIDYSTGVIIGNIHDNPELIK